MKKFTRVRKHFYFNTLGHYTKEELGTQIGAHMQNDLVYLIELIAKNKDKKAFRSLYAFVQPKIYYYLIKSGASRELALELAQESMIKIWKKAHLFDPSKGPVMSWLFTIVRNTRFDYYRKDALNPINAQSLDIYQLEIGDIENSEMEKIYQRVEAENLISQLSSDNQLIIKYVYKLGLTHLEISKRENIPLGTVKSRIRLALNQMKTILEEK